MKATIAYEVLFFLKIYIFEDILISECHILKTYSKYKVKELTKWCLQFSNISNFDNVTSHPEGELFASH